MPSPIMYPSWLAAMICFPRFAGKVPNLLRPIFVNRAITSGPVRYRSVMWYDRSSSAQSFFHACCSARQLEYSGATTGNAWGTSEEDRKRLTGPPIAFRISSRFLYFSNAWFMLLVTLIGAATESPSPQQRHDKFEVVCRAWLAEYRRTRSWESCPRGETRETIDSDRIQANSLSFSRFAARECPDRLHHRIFFGPIPPT